MRSDMELLEAWQTGEENAGERLFERYYDSVYRFFRHKLEEDVGDLVQSTFFTLLTRVERARASSSFRAYLFGIAHNLFCSHLRERYRGGPDLEFGAVSVQDIVAGPSTAFARRQKERLLLEALRRIPIDYQVVLELRYWEQMKHTEIAEVLDVLPATARSRLRRAHELLEQELRRLADSSDELDQTFMSLQEWARDCRDRLEDADDAVAETVVAETAAAETAETAVAETAEADQTAETAETDDPP